LNIIITGTSRGIGLYLVNHFLAKNWNVIGISRGDSDIDNSNYTHLNCDLTSEESVNDCLKIIKKKFKKCDALINNAGIASMNHIMFTTYKTAEKVFATNFLSPFIFTREVSKIMMKSNFGRIVNISTVAVPLRLEGEAIYASSKAALEMFTKITAKELAPFNITVNAVGPSPVNTNLISSVPKEKIENLISKQAIKKYGTEKDISNVIDFFMDINSHNISGQIIYLGGIS
jgi:3-oxoacyl-[acyl-carrier protein] reductase